MDDKIVFIFILLSVVSPGMSLPGKPGAQSDKYAKFYRKQFRKVKLAYKMSQERNLQLSPAPKNMFFPVNVTRIQRKQRKIPSLMRFLHNYSRGHLDGNYFTRGGRTREFPIFNRFQVRKRLRAQMDCGLFVRMDGMHNYFTIGVVLVRLTFTSTCRSTSLTKFIWVNNFDASSHFHLRINRMRYIFLFGNTFQDASKYGNVVMYNSYKLLTIFRARTLRVRGVPSQIGQTLRRRRRIRREINQAQRSRGNENQARPRNLVDNEANILNRQDTINLSEVGNENKNIFVNGNNIHKDADSLNSLKEIKKLNPNSEGPNSIVNGQQPHEIKKIGRGLRTRKQRKRRRRQQKKRRNQRKRRQRRRRKQNRQTPKPYQQQRRPPPPPPPRPMGQTVAQPPPNPHILASVARPVHVPAQMVIPPRRRNFNASFSNLLNQNDESRSVFMRRIPEPINILPLIPWRPIERRREILSSGQPGTPFWPFRTIRRIWRGRNPQIAPYRDIPLLRDGIVTVRI